MAAVLPAVLLKERALGFVADLREELRIYKEASTAHTMSYRVQNITAEARQENFNTRTENTVRLFNDLMQRYSESFKIRAFIYRDDLRGRLGPDYKSVVSMGGHDPYTNPTNTFCIQHVADDLEHMAHSLSQ